MDNRVDCSNLPCEWQRRLPFRYSVGAIIVFRMMSAFSYGRVGGASSALSWQQFLALILCVALVFDCGPRILCVLCQRHAGLGDSFLQARARWIVARRAWKQGNRTIMISE